MTPVDVAESRKWPSKGGRKRREALLRAARRGRSALAVAPGKMADREEALREFVAVTGAEEERARFFLESAGGDLQARPAGRGKELPESP